MATAVKLEKLLPKLASPGPVKPAALALSACTCAAVNAPEATVDNAPMAVDDSKDTDVPNPTNSPELKPAALVLK